MRKARRLFAGVRTFPLIALTGVLSILLLDTAGPWLLVVSSLFVAAVTVISYIRSTRAGQVGATTEVAALGTFLLGALARTGRLLPAAAAGVTVALLLVAKVRLERFSKALSERELLAALELAVISSIVLPLLPNQDYGPWQALNPFQIWLVVVLVSALSFAGFVAARVLGRNRGLVLSAAFGALVSSTAVTVSMAARARDDGDVGRAAAAATVLASTIMCARVLILVGAVAAEALTTLLPVTLTMAVVGSVASWILLRQVRDSGEGAGEELSSPLHLRAALAFGTVYAAMLVAVRAAQAHFGSSGVMATSAISGVVDVDAIAIALARSGGLSVVGWNLVAAGIAVAMVTNTVVKLILAAAIGRGRFGKDVAISLALMAAAGSATALSVWLRQLAR